MLNLDETAISAPASHLGSGLVLPQAVRISETHLEEHTFRPYRIESDEDEDSHDDDDDDNNDEDDDDDDGNDNKDDDEDGEDDSEATENDEAIDREESLNMVEPSISREIDMVLGNMTSILSEISDNMTLASLPRSFNSSVLQIDVSEIELDSLSTYIMLQNGKVKCRKCHKESTKSGLSRHKCNSSSNTTSTLEVSRLDNGKSMCDKCQKVPNMSGLKRHI